MTDPRREAMELAQVLKETYETTPVNAWLTVAEKALAWHDPLRRIECCQCGRSPRDEPDIVLTRINPKGLRGVYRCQHCPEGRG